VGPLEPGTAVRVVRHGRGWLLVQVPGDQRGWIADATVALVGG
jgi:hypothetical protein